MGASVTRAIRNFNLENRAEREISKMKPSPAPRHPSTQGLLREQMSGEGCEGACRAAQGSLCRRAAPAGGRGGSGRGEPGGRRGSGQPGAGRWGRQAGDIEPVPWRSSWSRRLRSLGRPGEGGLCLRRPRLAGFAP